LHTQWAEAAIFSRPSRDSVAQQITNHLRRRIVTGDLRPGRRLPSVRKLAGLYGVSTPTVGAAVHALASLGFVRVSRGVGMFVAFPEDHMSLLSYVWRTASGAELAAIRSAIDSHVPALVARDVRTKPRSRLPRTIEDINFLVHERSVCRLSDPRQFIEADLNFHRTVAASVRGMEVGPALYERVGQRLMSVLMPVANVQAADQALDESHMRLAAAMLGGDSMASARSARHVALVEQRSLANTLG
jgi:GntR family transcriptional repressor for pyruvate dehydrogenase complex